MVAAAQWTQENGSLEAVDNTHNESLHFTPSLK
jgi:hypothetical protein